MEKLKAFLRESKQEFDRVNWPTQKETIKLVGIVITISLVMAVFLGFLDLGFLEGIKQIIGVFRND